MADAPTPTDTVHDATSSAAPTHTVSAEAITMTSVANTMNRADVAASVVGTVAAVVVVLAHRSNLLLTGGLVGVVAASTWLSVIDLRVHRLPNRIVGPLAAAVVAWIALLGAVEGEFSRSLGALGWGLGAAAVFFGLHLLANLGMGDVKFVFPLAATLGWFGWPSLQAGLYALCLIGGVAGLIVTVQGKGKSRRMAYGPFMALGLVVGVVHAGLT